MIGLGAAAAMAALVFVGVYRRPTPKRLALGLAAISLGAFVALTTMHQRYADPALIFLLLAWPRRRVFAAWAVLAVMFALDLVVSARSGGVEIGDGISVVGAVAITAVAVATLRWTWAGVRGPAVSDAGTDPPSPCRTSAGNAGATSGA